MNTTNSTTRHIGCAALGVFTLCILGCARQPTLACTWRGTANVSPGIGTAAVTYEFGADGIEQLSAKLPPQNPAAPGSPVMAMLGMGGYSNIHAAGTYTVTNDVLSITTTQFTMLNAQGQPSPLTGSTNAQTHTLRFHLRGDTLSLDSLDGTPPATLTRQKA